MWRARGRAFLATPARFFSLHPGPAPGRRVGSDKGGLYGRDPAGGVDPPAPRLPRPLLLVAPLAQQLQVVPVQSDLRIMHVVPRQRNLVMCFQWLLFRSWLDDPSRQAPLAEITFRLCVCLSASPPLPAGVECFDFWIFVHVNTKQRTCVCCRPAAQETSFRPKNLAIS